jgi:hypothetical protein
LTVRFVCSTRSNLKSNSNTNQNKVLREQSRLPLLRCLEYNYTMATSYKPSPLSYGSPRASPFRRPESPLSPSPLRQSTPNPSPTKAMASTTPSRLANSSTSAVEVDTWTPRGLAPAPREREPSPTRGANASPGFGGMLANVRNTRDNNALLKLQPAQVRELREGFQILDRDGDGHVGRDDVADMLTQLGQCLYSQAIPYLQFPGMAANPSDITPFFPPSTPQNITLPAYLNSLASLLAVLSPPPELLKMTADKWILQNCETPYCTPHQTQERSL